MLRVKRIGIICLLLATVSTCFAQWRRQREFNAADAASYLNRHRQRKNIPLWRNEPGFEAETFTFARVQYRSYGRRSSWEIDYPDSDLNFSLRLQQLTSMKVNPEPVIVKLSDEDLFDYPFLYLIEPGGIRLNQQEIEGLRRYCLNGGFLMVDDFWGDWEYQALQQAMTETFPDRKIEELDITHEIFHIVYDLDEMPQIPSIGWAYDGNTWEVRKGPSAKDVHYRAIKDDEGRIMVLICHNTDLGDGWEKEGENREYFQEFSVKKAYPMGINIVTYAMTH